MVAMRLPLPLARMAMARDAARRSAPMPTDAFDARETDARSAASATLSRLRDGAEGEAPAAPPP